MARLNHLLLLMRLMQHSPTSQNNHKHDENEKKQGAATTTKTAFISPRNILIGSIQRTTHQNYIPTQSKFL